MKQITNKEYEEWQKYKEEKAKGHILMPDTLRFICAANDYDPTKIGQHFLEMLPKVSGRTRASPAATDLTDARTKARTACLIKSSGGNVNIRTGNGTSYSRITAVAPGTTLEYVASAFNGWQAVKIGSQVGWVSGEYSEITTE